MKASSEYDMIDNQFLNNLAGEDESSEDAISFINRGNSDLIKNVILCHEFYNEFDDLLEETMSPITFTPTGKSMLIPCYLSIGAYIINNHNKTLV